MKCFNMKKDVNNKNNTFAAHPYKKSKVFKKWCRQQKPTDTRTMPAILMKAQKEEKEWK